MKVLSEGTAVTSQGRFFQELTAPKRRMVETFDGHHLSFSSFNQFKNEWRREPKHGSLHDILVN